MLHNCRAQLVEIYKNLCTTFSTPKRSNIPIKKQECITAPLSISLKQRQGRDKESIFTSQKDDEPPEVEEIL